MKRYLEDNILKDIRKKMIIVTGPRQVGKTYMAKRLMKSFNNSTYLNYDVFEDKKIIQQHSWKINSDFLIFDEIHKMKNWKSYIKGIFDSRKENQSILITGSARLETFRKTGESLAGRYFHYHLNPLSLAEINFKNSAFEILEKLMDLGSFPEPFLSNSREDADRWRNLYFQDLIREDILEFSRINELNDMKNLLQVLRTKVGSPLSISSICNSLNISYNTVKRYINILEALYIVFLIKPYHKKIARAIIKEPKLYFYDPVYVKADRGIIFENLVAISLLKYCQYMQDSYGKDTTLNYIRTKEKKEVDFALVEKGEIKLLIEVKLQDHKISKHLQFFTKNYNIPKSIQLVHNLRKESQQGSIEVLNASQWLSQLPA